MSDHDGEWVCELCHEHVLAEQPQLRITADAVISKGDGTYDSLSNHEVMVFSVFHSACLRDTMEDDSLGDVPYIWEARAIFSALPACEDCLRLSNPSGVKRTRPTHLKLVQGGVR